MYLLVFYFLAIFLFVCFVSFVVYVCNCGTHTRAFVCFRSGKTAMVDLGCVYADTSKQLIVSIMMYITRSVLILSLFVCLFVCVSV